MNASVLIILAVIGSVISIIIYLKGKKPFLALIVAIMTIMLFVVGYNGYQEIKVDANIYRPLASQWLEAKENNPGVASKMEEKDILFSPGDNNLHNFSIYCIYFSPDNSKAVVYVQLPSSPDDLVMVFNRSNKRLDEVHFMPKQKKPEPNFQNKVHPAILFY